MARNLIDDLISKFERQGWPLAIVRAMERDHLSLHDALEAYALR